MLTKIQRCFPSLPLKLHLRIIDPLFDKLLWIATGVTIVALSLTSPPESLGLGAVRQDESAYGKDKTMTDGSTKTVAGKDSEWRLKLVVVVSGWTRSAMCFGV